MKWGIDGRKTPPHLTRIPCNSLIIVSQSPSEHRLFLAFTMGENHLMQPIMKSLANLHLVEGIMRSERMISR